MGLSAASMNPVRGISSYRSTVAQAYNIDNKADFSDAFVESLKRVSSADSVGGVPPIQYPTAKIMTNRISQISETQRVSEGLNSIAKGFEGITTGYGNGGGASRGYGIVGSQIDLFA